MPFAVYFPENYISYPINSTVEFKNILEPQKHRFEVYDAKVISQFIGDYKAQIMNKNTGVYSERGIMDICSYFFPALITDYNYSIETNKYFIAAYLAVFVKDKIHLYNVKSGPKNVKFSFNIEGASAARFIAVLPHYERKKYLASFWYPIVTHAPLPLASPYVVGKNTQTTFQYYDWLVENSAEEKK